MATDTSKIRPENQRILDRMDRGHMQPVIEFGDCWECETEHGETFVVPDNVVGISFDGDTHEDPSIFSDYIPEGCCGKCTSATVRRNVWIARLSAPGYLDCTEWELHDTADDAAQSLISNYGDEGDEDLEEE